MQRANQSSSRLSWVTDIMLLGVLITVFYFLWLGSYPYFTPDEGRYSEVAREMLVSGDFVTPRVNGVAFLDKPALYYWLQAAAMYLFGVHEWAVRFFPALYGIAGSLIVYLAARRLFNRRTGILSAIILATTPLFFGGSHYANLDLEVAVLVSASLLTFLLGAETQGKARTVFFLLAYTFAGFAFLTKGLLAIAFPVIIAGLWILLLSRWRLLLQMRLITGLIIIAVITLPWFILVQRANPEFLHFFFITQQVARFLSATEFNNPSPIWFYWPVVLAGLIPWTAFLLQAVGTAARACWQARAQHAPELFLLLWAAVVFIFFSIPHSKTVSYILPIFPALAILMGKYLADVWQERSQSLGITLGIGMLIILNTVFAAFFFLMQYHWIDLPIAFIPTLYSAGIELGISALLLLLLSKWLRVPLMFYIATATSVVMLLTFATGAEYMSPNSAKPLVRKLQTLIQPTDTVVNYFKFYQDVPLYLGRTIILVADWQSPAIARRDNWVRELWYSMPFQNTDEILLNENTFWKRWHSREKIFVFVNQNYLAQFQSHTNQFEFLGQYHDIILLSNH